MQRSVSRVVPNVYIAVSFCDEMLRDVGMILPVEVDGGISQQSVVCSDCFYNACT